MKKQLYTVVYL